ncbi:MAG TPA: RES family NAD+ phosphorylase [Polyangia bacterium]
MRCAGPSRVSSFAATAWRVVEAQHQVSTRKLVDTLEEQQLLEQIVDQVKPSLPPEPAFAGLHYLLSTPFRHPPLLRGTRFGSAAERSLWYGALRVETSLAEKAYYQLLFAQGTAAAFDHLTCDWTAFSAAVATERAVDLTAPAFAAFARPLNSPVSYAATQKLGRQMRASGVIAFVFTSARCPSHGKAIGLFSPAFAAKKPGAFQTWKCIVTTTGCEVVRLNGARAPLVFPRAAFEIDGKFPAPSTNPP